MWIDFEEAKLIAKNAMEIVASCFLDIVPTELSLKGMEKIVSYTSAKNI